VGFSEDATQCNLRTGLTTSRVPCCPHPTAKMTNSPARHVVHLVASPMSHGVTTELIKIYYGSLGLYIFTFNDTKAQTVTVNLGTSLRFGGVSLPQPSDSESVDGLPVVQLPEDSELLNSLISILYPVRMVIPNSYDKVPYLLAASQR
jgi:hypothetical protein